MELEFGKNGSEVLLYLHSWILLVVVFLGSWKTGDSRQIHTVFSISGSHVNHPDSLVDRIVCIDSIEKHCVLANMRRYESSVCDGSFMY